MRAKEWREAPAEGSGKRGSAGQERVGWRLARWLDALDNRNRWLMLRRLDNYRSVREQTDYGDKDRG